MLEINGKQYYYLEEVCDKLGLAYSTIRKWIRLGKVKASKHGKRWLISDDELNRYMSSLDTNAPKWDYRGKE